jgi:hypothetical protein
LWITVIRNLRSAVGFTVNDRSLMPPMTLIAVVRSHKRNGVPLEVLFRGGQHRQLSVRSVGEDWFSAQETGVLGSELVITLDAISLMRGDPSELERDTTSSSCVPLAAMLVQLERQRTRVIVHLEDHALVGHLNGVGEDFVSLTQRDGTHVLIPLEALLWLEACG